MATWEQFEAQAPGVAAGGRKLIYQFGIGLGYLATNRPDGGIRIHPFCPVLEGGHLYGFIVPSPKRNDLLRDGRYAFHTFAAEDRDDEFFCSGAARHIDDEATWARALTKYQADGGNAVAAELLFEFELDRAMLATYKPRSEGDTWPPQYRTWRADR
ncbi:MAG: hypothetical protein ACM3S1_13520 [Hyphomicrobiales bacterium]